MNHPLSIALIGNPNCGKTALFNRLTGSHQKVANYAGVTVERKEGSLTTEAGRQFHIIDLPGIYSLTPLSQDEEITRSALIDKTKDIPIDLVVFVADATNLKRSLKLIIDVIQLGYPTVLALNMTDLARKSGQVVDLDILQKELGIPVVETTAIQSDGIKSLLDILDKPEDLINRPSVRNPDESADIKKILGAAIRKNADTYSLNQRIDAFVLHPLLGFPILLAILFFMFQAVFSWAEFPK